MRIGELLIQKKLLTQAQLDEALEEQKYNKDFIGMILVARKFIREPELMKVLSEQFHMPLVDLKKEKIDWEMAMRFTPTLVVEHLCLPFRMDDYGVYVAIANPLDAEAIQLTEEQVKGLRVLPYLAPAADIREAVKLYNRKLSERIKKLFE